MHSCNRSPGQTIYKTIVALQYDEKNIARLEVLAEPYKYLLNHSCNIMAGHYIAPICHCLFRGSFIKSSAWQVWEPWKSPTPAALSFFMRRMLSLPCYDGYCSITVMSRVAIHLYERVGFIYRRYVLF